MNDDKIPKFIYRTAPTRDDPFSTRNYASDGDWCFMIINTTDKTRLWARGSASYLATIHGVTISDNTFNVSSKLPHDLSYDGAYVSEYDISAYDYAFINITNGSAAHIYWVT